MSQYKLISKKVPLAISKKIQLDNTLLVCGQDDLASFKRKKQTKKVGNQLVKHMDMLGIPRGKNWIDRKQVKADIDSGKIHDNTCLDHGDFGKADVRDSKNNLNNTDNRIFILYKDGGDDPYFSEDTGVTALPIYGDDIDPVLSKTDTGNGYFINYYQNYLNNLKETLKTLRMAQRILKKTDDVQGYAQKLIKDENTANKKAKEAREHAKKVASYVHNQLYVINKIDGY